MYLYSGPPLIFFSFLSKIEHVSLEIVTNVAQFIYMLWPVFILAALFFAFQGIHFRRKTSILARVKAIFARMRFDLFATWTFLFFIWMVTLFASGPNNTILPEPLNSLVFFGGYALLAALEILPRLNTAFTSYVRVIRAHSLYELKVMDPYRFEDLVTATYRGLGYRVHHVGHSGDHGVDIELVTRSGEYWIIQCKRYQDTVGESLIRELYGTMVSEGAKRAVMVTTADITQPAEDWARGKPIDLVDGPRLLALIDEARRRREGTLLDRLARWWVANFNGHPLPQSPAPQPTATVPHSPVPAQRPAVTVPRSPASERVPNISPLEHTQPVHSGRPVIAGHVTVPMQASQGHSTGHTNGSAPLCPVCGVRMVRRPARPTDRPGRVLYRCRNYPACRVVLDK